MMRRIAISLCFLMMAVSAAMADEILSPSAEVSIRELRAIVDERSKANSQRFEAQEKAVAAALAATKEAISKQDAASEKRFDSVNEFRSTLKDQQLLLITRNEVDIRFKSLDDKIAANNYQITQLVSRAEGASQLWGIISVGIGLMLTLAMAVMAFRQKLRSE